MALEVEVEMIWIVAPRSVVIGYHRYRRPW